MALEMQGRSSDGYAMDWLWLGLYHALAMLWATFCALVLIILMWLLIRLFLPKTLEAQIRQRAANQTVENGRCRHEHLPSAGSGAAGEHEHELATAIPSVGGQEDEKWTGVAHAFVVDWSMLWKEILGGFL